MFTFQSLYTGQFIITDHFFTVVSQVWGLLIEMVDIACFFNKLFFIFAAGQPVTDLMRFEIRFFLKDDRRAGAKWSQRGLV